MAATHYIAIKVDKKDSQEMFDQALDLFYFFMTSNTSPYLPVFSSFFVLQHNDTLPFYTGNVYKHIGLLIKF